MSHLQSIGGDVEAALESINVPSYVVDRSGVVRWLNKAARRLVGDVRGRQFTSVVAPEETRRAREVFARNISGPHGPTDSQVVVIGADGERVGVELSSVPLMQGDRVIGVFGQVADVEDSTPRGRIHISRPGRPRCSGCSSSGSRPTTSPPSCT